MKNHFVKKTEISPGRKKGQAIVEFVLVLPILMLVLIGIIEFSRLFFAWIIIENSTRFGVRYATTGNHDPVYCQPPYDFDGNGVPGVDLDNNLTYCDDASEDAEVDFARIPSIKDETRRIIVGFHYDQALTEADQDYLNITICSAKGGRLFTPPLMGRPVYANCTLNGIRNEHAADPGQRVVVAADYNFTFMVLPIFKIEPSMIHLASYREGIVELFRATRAINTPIPLLVPTAIVTPSNTPSNTPSPTETPSPTSTFTPTLTPTPTETATSTPTPTFTPTATFTNTPTPTKTPVPSCANISINRTRFYDDNFEARVINKNFSTAYLISSTLIFDPSPLTGGRYYDKTSFGGIYHDPSNTLPNSSITNSSISTSSTPPALPIAGNSSIQHWQADFSDINFTGIYTVTLIFNFPGWGNCTLTGDIDNFTLTPTTTFTPSRTPTRTLIPTRTLTPSRTPTPPPTRTPSRTPLPSNTPSPTKTFTPSNTPTQTATSTKTSTPTQTATRTQTPLPSNTPTKTTVPPTRTPTHTPTPSPTATLLGD